MANIFFLNTGNYKGLPNEFHFDFELICKNVSCPIVFDIEENCVRPATKEESWSTNFEVPKKEQISELIKVQ